MLSGANFAKNTNVRLDCSYRTVAIQNLRVESAERVSFDVKVPADVEPSRCVMVLEVPPPMTAEIGPTAQSTPQIVQVVGPSFSVSGSSGRAGASGGCGVNLIAGADPAGDAINGRWIIDNGALLSDGTPAARLGFRVVPPEEYDLRVDFTREQGRDSVVFILAKDTQRFVLEIGGWDGIAGFALIDGRNVDANPTKIRFPLTNGQRYSVVVRVRNTGLEALINGQAGVSYPTDYRNLTLNPDWALPGKPGLGLGSFAASTRFHVAELMPSRCGSINANSINPLPSAAQGPGGLPTGYARCARENERCQFSGVADVAYGANGKFTLKYGLQNGVDCNNGVFGDPTIGVVKDCFIKRSVSP